MYAPDSPYRERFRLTLEHRPVDRCPFDLGGTPQATIDEESTREALAQYLGFDGPALPEDEYFDRRISEALDIDFRRVGRELSFETGRRQQISATEFIDEWGSRFCFSGIYWERVAGPLWEATLDQVAAYQFPTAAQIPPGTLDDFARHAQQLYQHSPYVVAACHPVFGVLELACWLCGYDYLMLQLAADPEFIHLLFGKILAYQKSIIREYYRRLGPYLHLTTSGDDFGTQKGAFMSPAMFREFVIPYLRERIAYTALFTDAVYMHHTCGAVFELIPDLIDVGVRVLNPIQPMADGMDPARLKAAYGDQLVFHGGLDTQEVLPSNDPAGIDAAVEHLLAAMHPETDGGFIFAPAHNLQRDVSPASIARSYRTAREHFNAKALSPRLLS